MLQAQRGLWQKGPSPQGESKVQWLLDTLGEAEGVRYYLGQGHMNTLFSYLASVLYVKL